MMTGMALFILNISGRGDYEVGIKGSGGVPGRHQCAKITVKQKRGICSD